MNVFACMSDEMAIGAIQALTAAGKDMNEIVVLGVDGSDLAREYLMSGALNATAARDVDKEVLTALDTAEKVAAGETVPKEVRPGAIYALTSDDVRAAANMGPITIGVSMNSADQFRTLWLNDFKAIAESRGHTVFSTNADNNPSTQISDIESLIARNPDIIVVTPLDSEGIIPAIEACNAANIPVINIDMPVGIEVAAMVTDLQGLNGEICGQYLLKWLDAQPGRVANVGYIVGMYAMEAAMPRMNEFKATIGGDSRVTWIADREAGWSGAEAMSITEDWIQAYPEMNVFACMSDEMAIGAIQALVAAGKNMDEVVVLGVDGSDLAMEYLRNGYLNATAARDVKKEVTAALDTAEKVAAGISVPKEVRPGAIYALTSDDVK
jgi:ABC-type sugar transport system substrate-binding protein